MEVYRVIHADIKTPHTSIDDCMLQIKAVAQIFKKNQGYSVSEYEALENKLMNIDGFLLTTSVAGLSMENDK